MPAKGQKLTDAQRKHLSDIQKGKPKSEEFKKKCRERMKGKPSPNPWVGKKMPKEIHEKCVHRGKYHYNYGKSLNASHGECIKGSRTTEYTCWIAMKQRCYNQKNRAYHNYGGRGITVCKRWLDSFENFLDDMGRRPENKSIDRIDNDGNYEPNNCRWATKKQQYDNSRLKQDNKGKFKIC